MKVIERMIQEIFPGQNEALEDLDKRYAALESKIGFPAKRRMWAMSAPYTFDTLIIEREWDSMAAMEAAFEKSFANQDLQALGVEGRSIIKSVRVELYMAA
ncbi:MAG: hypothetical protein KC441_17970 [Anaerolineales bacterium]|nr:hypothetical protein [Anaerolineales bacterium]